MDEKRKEEEVRELTPEEIDDMIFEEQIASGEHNEKVPEYYFSNPDPYAKIEPRPDDAPKRDIKFDENGNIVVRNLSAFWLPEVTIVDEVGGADGDPGEGKEDFEPVVLFAGLQELFKGAGHEDDEHPRPQIVGQNAPAQQHGVDLGGGVLDEPSGQQGGKSMVGPTRMNTLDMVSRKGVSICPVAMSGRTSGASTTMARLLRKA